QPPRFSPGMTLPSDQRTDCRCCAPAAGIPRSCTPKLSWASAEIHQHYLHAKSGLRTRLLWYQEWWRMACTETYEAVWIIIIREQMSVTHNEEQLDSKGSIKAAKTR
ncbi:hypothetical protein NECAME_17457, partial [Necator americanus]